MTRWVVRAAVLVLLAVGVLGLRERLSEPEDAEAGEEPKAATEVERTPLPAESVAARPEPRDVEPSASDPWPEANRRGIEHLRAGELDEAIELFRRCHEAVPDESAYRSNLAEAFVRLALRRREERDPAAALANLERALLIDPAREEDLAGLLERWREEARVEDEFSSFDSPYFALSFDGSRAELLDASQRFLDTLEDAYTDLRLWFGYDPVLEGRPPFRVVLYRRAEFEQLTGLGDWAAGAFDGTIRLPLEERSVDGGGWRVVARHELVHAFLRELGGPALPGWLNEGLAQWLEGAPARQVAAARERLRGRTLFDLARLRSSLAGWKDESAIHAAYDQSLAFVDHLLANYGESVVVAMVRAGRAGAAPEAVFLERTGVTLDVVSNDLAQELR